MESFSSLDALMETLQQSLSLLFNEHCPSRRLTFVQSLVHVASIRLHYPFFLAKKISRAKCLSAARSVVYRFEMEDVLQFPFVGPFMGVRCAASVCDPCLTRCFRRCGSLLPKFLLQRSRRTEFSSTSSLPKTSMSCSRRWSQL